MATPESAPEERIERFREFHRRTNRRPLLGACVGGWEGFNRYVRDTVSFLPKGTVPLEAVTVKAFEGMYGDYAASLSFADDLVRGIEPVPSIPWAEAAAGCPVEFTGTNFWAAGAGVPISGIGDPAVEGNPWISRYREFLTYLQKEYGDRFPVSQAILRGPLDILCAAVGEGNMVYALYDSPGEAVRLLNGYTKIVKAFLRLQNEQMLPWRGGRVVGQYHIWTPGSCARLQQDAQSLLSPALYERYVLPFDEDLSAASEYNLFHMHASALHLLDLILGVKGISILQISKDEGVSDMAFMIPALVKIQKAGRGLVLKGRLTPGDLDLISKNLDPGGLCLQFVTGTAEEAGEAMKAAAGRWG